MQQTVSGGSIGIQYSLNVRIGNTSILGCIFDNRYVFYSLSEQEELIAWKPAMYAVTAGAAALYALFYPVLVGIQIPSWYGTCLLRWLPSWPF